MIIMLVKEIKNIFYKELNALYPREEISSFFNLLLEHHLGFGQFILALNPQLTLSKEEESPLFEALSRLKLEEPIQYILGETYFYNERLKINNEVLIPRPETEELVHWILKDHQNDTNTQRVLDIGTGSGNIAIVLAKNLENVVVDALDIKKGAIHLARENASEKNVKISFIEGDICELNDSEEKYDIIVSNPPYVRQLEKKKMKNNVIKFEPPEALYVSDEDPLIYYKCIGRFAIQNLKDQGYLYLEINQYLSRDLITLLDELKFSEIEIRKDIYGNDRMLKAKYVLT